MKVLILGRNEILYDTAQAIAQQAEHRIVGIVTAHSQPEYKRTEDDFKLLADKVGAQFMVSETINQTVRELVISSGAEIAISINWVSLVKENFINLLPYGVINAHFGDLPSYRGNAVTNWALIRGEDCITLTVHLMAPGELDSGDIIAQRQMPVTDETTINHINEFAQQQIPGMMLDSLAGLANQTLQPIPQSGRQLPVFRCYPRLPEDGLIDWKQSAIQIHRQVRALMKPYSGAYTHYRDAEDRLRQLMIWEAAVVAPATDDIGMPGHIIRNDKTTGESWILTGEGILAIRQCSHENGPDFAPGFVWRSIRMRLGMNVEDELYRIALQLESQKLPALPLDLR